MDSHSNRLFPSRAITFKRNLHNQRIDLNPLRPGKFFSPFQFSIDLSTETGSDINCR